MESEKEMREIAEELNDFLWGECFRYDHVEMKRWLTIIDPCPFFAKYIKKYGKPVKEVRIKDCKVEPFKEGIIIKYISQQRINCENVNAIIMMMLDALKIFEEKHKLPKMVYLDFASTTQPFMQRNLKLRS